MYLPHARPRGSVGVASQRSQPGPFPRGIGHHLVALEKEAEVDDAADEHQQQRQHERELHELGAPLGTDAQGSYRNHRAATVPAEMGSAYGSRGLEAVRKVRPGMGCRPAIRQ